MKAGSAFLIGSAVLSLLAPLPAVSTDCRPADGRDTVRVKLSLLPDADMLQKPTIIAVLVITVLTGIYFSMTAEDRDR